MIAMHDSLIRSDFTVQSHGAPEIIPVGQLYFPSNEEYDDMMRGIFERQYYTNHGVLARSFEDQLEGFLGVRHAIVVANATLGLMMIIRALDLEGEIVVPSFTFAATAQAVIWAGCTPVFADIDPETHHLTASTVEAVLTERTTAVIGVNLWGDTAPVDELQHLATSHGLKLLFDSAQAFGCSYHEQFIGNFGDAEVFSFHATKILSSAEGGCVTTNDDALAMKLRNIRSSYGSRVPVEVPLTSNARFSEAQAALGIWSLTHFEQHRERNQELRRAYEQMLIEIEGISLHPISSAMSSNYQYLTCEVDAEVFGISRDELLDHLLKQGIIARRYFYPGLHRIASLTGAQDVSRELPGTDALVERVLQLPLGALVDVEALNLIYQGLLDAKSVSLKVMR